MAGSEGANPAGIGLNNFVVSVGLISVGAGTNLSCVRSLLIDGWDGTTPDAGTSNDRSDRYRHLLYQGVLPP
jgi:cAMP phosphodiesterase